jgi:hypothetical protein
MHGVTPNTEHKGNESNACNSRNSGTKKGARMERVITFEKLVTKPRPLGSLPATPVQEIRSTHVANCPHCSTEARVKTGHQADVFGGCIHFRGIEQTGTAVSILFTDEAFTSSVEPRARSRQSGRAS